MVMRLNSNKSPSAIFLYLLLCLFVVAAEGREGCLSPQEVVGPTYRFDVNERLIVRRESLLLGFNLEWYAFQRSVWDSEKRRIAQDVREFLRMFPNAVYRYPGGQTANVMDWRDFVGASSSRHSNSFFNWRPPVVADFGIDEYMQFVRDVNGQAWYVVNIYGDLKGEQDSKKLAESAARLAAYIGSKAEKAMPPVLRWELGNELDRKPIYWSPEKTVESASLAAKYISSAIPGASYVIAQQEFPALKDRGYNLSQYNATIASGLKGIVEEYAMHFYFDGPPNGLSVQAHIDTLCKVIADLKSNAGASPSFWITESGRVPKGAWTKPDWKSDWKGTADLQAAISTADFVIALSSIPQVKGVFQHALHGADAPWPMFHQHGDGKWKPSAVFWALLMLQKSAKPLVLDAVSVAPHARTSAKNPDVRIVVQKEKSKSNYTIWAVNRSKKDVVVTFNIASFASQVAFGQRTVLTADGLEDSNYLENKVVPKVESSELNFDSSGNAIIPIKGQSVTVLQFERSVN